MVAQLVEALSYQAGSSRVQFPMASLDIFHWHNPSGPGVDSASNRNEYQEYFLGREGGRCVGLTALAPSCVDCLEIWEPQLPGSLRVCLGLYRKYFLLLSITPYSFLIFPPSCACDEFRTCWYQLLDIHKWQGPPAMPRSALHSS